MKSGIRVQVPFVVVGSIDELVVGSSDGAEANKTDVKPLEI